MNRIFLLIALVHSGKQLNEGIRQELNTELIDKMNLKMSDSIFLVNYILKDPNFRALKFNEKEETKELYHKLLIHLRNMKGLVEQWNSKSLTKTVECKNETNLKAINKARAHDIQLLKDTKSKLKLENRFTVDESNEEWLNTYIKKIKNVCVSNMIEIEKVISDLKEPLQDISKDLNETITKEKESIR
ncbi:hypothetical protein P3W45_000328 [Vairimorpha bombi]